MAFKTITKTLFETPCFTSKANETIFHLCYLHSRLIIKRENSTKFLGILIDDNLTWQSHIHYIENKSSKNIGLLYKATFLNQKCLKSIYFSFIHSYINYANKPWASTIQTKMKKLFRCQKHVSRIIYNEDTTTHARPLMKSLNALNVYQINILQNLLLTYKIKNNLAPVIFQGKFKSINHKYVTRHASQNFIYRKVASIPLIFESHAEVLTHGTIYQVLKLKH